MNAIDRFFLWLFLLPETLYRKAGIDNNHLRAILTAKLTMDNRRPNAFRFKQTAEKKAVNKATFGTIFGSFFVGLMLLFGFINNAPFVTQLTLFSSMFIFMLCATLITDFTAVLIDVRDNQILLPKPISDTTFLVSRLLHILVRICIVVIPMAFPVLIFIVGSARFAYILPYLGAVVFMTVLSLFLINLIYLLILKITTPTKFQSIIGSIQVVFMVVLMAMYQLLPRMLDSSNMETLNLASQLWARFYPPFWFAQSIELLAGHAAFQDAWISLVLVVFVPLLSVLVVVKYMAPSFNSKLTLITSGTVEQAVRKPRTAASKDSLSWLEKLGRTVTRSGAEYAGFLVSVRMMARSKDFKMKVYPSLGYLLVMAFLFISKDHRLENLANEKETLRMVLMVVYMCTFLISSALLQLPYSDKHKAAWLFAISPVDYPGKLLLGALKAVLVFFYVPVALLILGVGLGLQGFSILPNVLLGCANVFLICVIYAYVTLKKLPFSSLQIAASRGSTLIKTIALLLVPLVVGFSHWFISGYTLIVLSLLVVSVVMSWLLINLLKKRSWAELDAV